jgi:hypothetical protein
MTVIVSIGRRVAVNWFKRTASTVGGLVSFQTNIWMLIENSMQLAKRKATQSNTGIQFIIKRETEREDLHYSLQWLKVIIRGTKEQEEEEYREALGMYSKFKNIFGKKDFPKDDNLAKHFKSKLLNGIKVEEAYAKGYGDISENSIAAKLLEMGILTHVELIPDRDLRVEIPLSS